MLSQGHAEPNPFPHVLITAVILPGFAPMLSWLIPAEATPGASATRSQP